MDCLLNELINLLEQEMELYENFLKMSKDKTSIIVEGKVKELEKVIEMEQALILQMSKVENQRELIINKISKILNIKPEETTLTMLIEKAGEEQSEKLKAQQGNLAGLLKDLGSVNELNTRLIRSSLDYINFSLNLFANVEDQDNNYSLEGEKPSAKPKSLFDRKI